MLAAGTQRRLAMGMTEMVSTESKHAKILIVDDDPQVLKLLSLLLSEYDYLIETAQNGQECIENIRKTNPDLVLLDVFMPVMNGIDACRIIKADPEIRHIPIIVLTSTADHETKHKCLDAGANDFLAMPIDQTELVIRIKNLLKLQAFEEIRLKNRILVENKKVLEQKNMELEKAYSDLKAAQSQILQQEKMASIGQLAAGIAHEINNPVGFIMSNLGSLQKFAGKLTDFIKIQSDAIENIAARKEEIETVISRVKEKKRSMKIDYIIDDLTKLINESLDGATRMKQIVQDLKAFSRTDEKEQKPADINAGLESTINIVWNELKYKAVVKKEYGDIPRTKCNLGQLNQVFMNILVNAAQAIDKQGEITVRTWQEGGNINVSISDTGAGIPPEHLNRIFEPFFTTKEVGKGTGLGMSIAYDIVKKHKGEIIVESDIGKGTTFTIKIPIG